MGNGYSYSSTVSSPVHAREAGRYIFVALVKEGFATVALMDRAGEHRVVIAQMPEGKELMVAVEHQGCAFLNAESHTNRFAFIADGFQLEVAEMLTEIFAGMADARAEVRSTCVHQIEDKRS